MAPDDSASLPAEPQVPSFPSRFQVEETSAPIRRRNWQPEGARVTRSGRVTLNRSASELVISLIGRQYDDLSKCGILWAPDSNSGEVAGRIVAPSVKGVTPIRRTAKKDTLVVYLNHVFKANPAFRPTSTASVSISRATPAEGGDFFWRYPNSGQARQGRQQEQHWRRQAGGRTGGGRRRPRPWVSSRAGGQAGRGRGRRYNQGSVTGGGGVVPPSVARVAGLGLGLGGKCHRYIHCNIRTFWREAHPSENFPANCGDNRPPVLHRSRHGLPAGRGGSGTGADSTPGWRADSPPTGRRPGRWPGLAQLGERPHRHRLWPLRLRPDGHRTERDPGHPPVWD